MVGASDLPVAFRRGEMVVRRLAVDRPVCHRPLGLLDVLDAMALDLGKARGRQRRGEPAPMALLISRKPASTPRR
jgi:hypothetical protein